MTDNQIERAIMALGRDLHGMGDAEAVFRSWFNKSPEKREVERQVRLVLEAAAPAIPEGWVMVPVEPTYELLRAMSESVAVDDEGPFPPLFDLLDFSGENKTYTVLRAAYAAMIAAAPPASQIKEG